jgi:hypothetical protein
MIAFFKGLDLARIGLWLLVGLAIGFSIWFHGLMSGLAKLDHYKAEQATEAARIIVKQGAVTTRVVTRYVEVKGATEIVTRDVEKEVVRYAQTNPDGLCIDADFVRLHNRAAANAVPADPGGAGGGLRAPGADPGGIRFHYRVPSAPDRDGELREASPVRGSPGRLAAVGY